MLFVYEERFQQKEIFRYARWCHFPSLTFVIAEYVGMIFLGDFTVFHGFQMSYLSDSRNYLHIIHIRTAMHSKQKYLIASGYVVAFARKFSSNGTYEVSYPDCRGSKANRRHLEKTKRRPAFCTVTNN